MSGISAGMLYDIAGLLSHFNKTWSPSEVDHVEVKLFRDTGEEIGVVKQGDYDEYEFFPSVVNGVVYE